MAYHMKSIKRNFVFPWLPIAGLALLAWVLAGCSAVKIKACLPGADECTTYKSRGESAIDNPELVYERELQDGSVVRLRFNAESSNREGDTVDAVIAEAIVDRLFNLTGGN